MILFFKMQRPDRMYKSGGLTGSFSKSLLGKDLVTFRAFAEIVNRFWCAFERYGCR